MSGDRGQIRIASDLLGTAQTGLRTEKGRLGMEISLRDTEKPLSDTEI